MISSLAVVVDFGWILVIHGGNLLAFNLNEMIPTSDPSTWAIQGKLQGVQLNPKEHSVSLVRMGYTKDRLMGQLPCLYLHKLGSKLTEQSHMPLRQTTIRPCCPTTSLWWYTTPIKHLGISLLPQSQARRQRSRSSDRQSPSSLKNQSS